MHFETTVFLSLKIFEYLWLLPKQLDCLVVYDKNNQASKYPNFKKSFSNFKNQNDKTDTEKLLQF